MVPMGAPSGRGDNAEGRAVPFSLPEKNCGIAATVIEYLGTLKVPEGPKAGQPLKLAEYQRAFIRGAFEPGVMVACLSIGRGNAKTALAAGVALGSVMGVWDTQPHREIILAARNRDQARTAFQFVVGFIEGLPDAEQDLFAIRRGAKLEWAGLL